MDVTILTTTTGRNGDFGKRFGAPFSKKSLFGPKKSDEWHQQINFTAGTLRPVDPKFPWILVRNHTDHYLKKTKGKPTQQDIDIRLALLINGHEAIDIAIAATAHAMSAPSVRALLNVELNVAPSTFYGLETFLQCLIAANYSSPMSVTNLETEWAVRLLPYATHGPGAAGKYLEGFCAVLKATDVPNMGVLPDFSLLARRAFQTFASQLEGFKLRSQWLSAYSATAWMSALARKSPASTPPGHLLPEHILDSQFPIWRIWSAWRPDLSRCMLLDGLDSSKKAVLPDLLSLEGPDFISGKYTTMREGMIAQYGANKRFARYRSIILEVPSCSRAELSELLQTTASAMEMALKGGKARFELFVKLVIERPITKEALKIFKAAGKIPDTPTRVVSDVIKEIYGALGRIGGRHISSLCKIIPVLDDEQAEDLRELLLGPLLVQGIEKCVLQCQSAVRTHIDTGLAWTHLALEFHNFCAILKTSTHCLPALDATIRSQLDVLPARASFQTIMDMYEYSGGHLYMESLPNNHLKHCIESFCIDKLMMRGSMKDGSRRTIEALLPTWTASTSDAHRTFAIEVCNRIEDVYTRCNCLSEIPSLQGQFVTEFVAILAETAREPDKSCFRLTKLLGNANYSDAIHGFRSILYGMLEQREDQVIEYTLNNHKAWEWSQWMLDLNALFADLIINSKIFVPTPLRLSLHMWTQQLSEFLPAITRLEEHLGDHAKPLQAILTGGDGLWVENLVKILITLSEAADWPVEKLMQNIVGRLLPGGGNAYEISTCVQALLGTNEDGLETCQRIMDMVDDKMIPLAVMEVSIAGWVDDAEVMKNDKIAIESLAALLHVEVYEDGMVPHEKLAEAAKYYEKVEQEVLNETDRLQEIQRALKTVDPKGTAVLLEQLGVQDVDPLDEEIENLPIGVIDAVERKGKNEVEVSFPLTHLTELQRAGLGIGTAKTLLIRFYLDYAEEMPAMFCLHLDNDPTLQDSTIEDLHTPWVCLRDLGEPIRPYCHGPITLLTWQLSRVLHRHFRRSLELKTISGLHFAVQHALRDMARCCIVCGTSHNAQHRSLRRATVCASVACAKVWKQAPIEVRIPEIRTDTFAVDMMLTGVYAAAMSGRTELLPGCPIKSTQSVVAILNSLPLLSVLQASPSISTTLLNAHKDAEELLTWACTHHRGLIASASGLCRIPNLSAGTHQFVLANAAPILETKFLTHIDYLKSGTRVLFHGTSLDRLPAILAQGLRVGSGTSLQRTGAAHGRGIYLAEEPSTSQGYSPSAVSWKNSGLNNMRLLFGCEIAGQSRGVGSGGIHVIAEEQRVMVRYVFLFPNAATVPIANHVVTPMSSAMSALRTHSV
ncbi:hypothetical protein EJ04DRAFT_109598 [Polyplosphaeria fusca]|uniref:Poly [ADP-ribose] polymerase n=1 Tax=Polyplosphaeria fusca TaxID=682080 RepID=A0A9P4QKW2_9PLEO|nr:hypothetical protein EJ04DRAFT_109598 [Polyplosphaeria fusca]